MTEKLNSRPMSNAKNKAIAENQYSSHEEFIPVQASVHLSFNLFGKGVSKDEIYISLRTLRDIPYDVNIRWSDGTVISAQFNIDLFSENFLERMKKVINLMSSYVDIEDRAESNAIELLERLSDDSVPF